MEMVNEKAMAGATLYIMQQFPTKNKIEVLMLPSVLARIMYSIIDYRKKKKDMMPNATSKPIFSRTRALEQERTLLKTGV